VGSKKSPARPLSSRGALRREVGWGRIASWTRRRTAGKESPESGSHIDEKKQGTQFLEESNGYGTKGSEKVRAVPIEKTGERKKGGGVWEDSSATLGVGSLIRRGGI